MLPFSPKGMLGVSFSSPLYSSLANSDALKATSSDARHPTVPVESRINVPLVSKEGPFVD